MGRRKILAGIFLVLLISLSFTKADAMRAFSRAKRTATLQAMGSLRKLEEMYAYDNPKGNYTDNLMDFAKYTNVTTLIKDAGGKISIQLSEDKKVFTATAKAKDICETLYAATPMKVTQASQAPDCIERERKERLRHDILDSLLRLAIFAIFLIFSFVFCKNEDRFVRFGSSLAIAFVLYILFSMFFLPTD